MPYPIFVIGAARSGTTWLANILCNHSKIAGIQAERHFGIHESIFFSHLDGRFGKLDKVNNFIQFVEIFASSDYFLLSGLNKELFYNRHPTTYHAFFRLLMDTYAKNHGAVFWLEKSPDHSLCLTAISTYYEDAKFVAIRRDIIATINSALKIRLRQTSTPFLKKKAILANIHEYYKYYKHIEYYASRSENIMLVEYEELRKSPSQVLKQICDFLGISFEYKMLKIKYNPNTSFGSESERKSFLTSADKRLIKTAGTFFDMIPYQIYRFEYLFKKNLKQSELPPWFFSIVKDDKIRTDRETTI